MYIGLQSNKVVRIQDPNVSPFEVKLKVDDPDGWEQKVCIRCFD